MEECLFGTTGVTTTPKIGRKAKSSKKSFVESKQPANDPPLNIMNALTERLEFFDDDSASPTVNLSQTSAKTTPTKRKGRKRKHSPTQNDVSSNSNAEKTTNTVQIHLVASNLNESILPSQSPPIVMVLSSHVNPSSDSNNTEKSCQCTGLAWSKIPGLEDVDVPMSCVLFASRSKCGPMIWNGILSAMKSNTAEERSEDTATDPNNGNEGIVLMGFQDGSLRASLVYTNEAMQNVNIDIKEAKKLLQLNTNEPIVNLQLLSPPSTSTTTTSNLGSILICVGAIGTVVTLSSSVELGEKSHGKPPKFAMQNSLKPCGGRWLSFACIGYHFMDKTKDRTVSAPSLDLKTSPNGLSFVAVNDSRQTFLHRLSPLRNHGRPIENENGANYGRSTYRLPFPARMISANAFPHPPFTFNDDSCVHVLFTASASNGKTTVSRMPLLLSESLGQSLDDLEQEQNNVASTSLFSMLRSKDCNSDKMNFGQIFQRNQEAQPPKLQTLFQKLQSATATQNKGEATQLLDSTNCQSNHALKEIREATQIAAFLKMPKSRNMPSPMQCEIKKHNPRKPGVLECTITAEKLPLAKQPALDWNHSVHFLHSCPQALSPMLRPKSIESMSPLCYRRTLRGSERPTKVLYGGTATSYSGWDDDEDIKDSSSLAMNVYVPMNDFIPVTAYASLSTVFACHLGETSQTDGTWCKSEKMLSESMSNDHGQLRQGTRNKYARPGNLHLPGSAKSASFRSNSTSVRDELLGASLPFDMGSKGGDSSLLPFDILSRGSTSNHHAGFGNVAGEKNARDVAEKIVPQWYQRTQREYVLPMVKEQYWIRRSSKLSTKCGKTGDDKIHCCSSSMRCINDAYNINEIFGGREVHCSNMGFGPLVIASRCNDDKRDNYMDQGIIDVGIAIGSRTATPSESMAILALARQAIVRRTLEGTHSQKIQKNENDLKATELYYRLLSAKRTAKILKHIGRSIEELLEKVESQQTKRSCAKDLIAATISLYETMRTLDIAL